MPIDDNKIYQKGLIITDNFSQKPILDFKSYRDAIVKIIEYSYPNFTIGIFGEWGTGKTTLMKNVFNELKNKNNNSIVPVWFNAWRYERENQFTLFPMLQTIANSIPERDGNKNKVKEAVSKFGRGFLKGLIKTIPDFASAVLPSAIGDPIKKTGENVANEVSAEFMSMVDKISESVINETLYSTQIEHIETAIGEVRETEDFKIVVFIDDLDRCSPNKALEVLESIKVFLDIDGFIFVIGLSHTKISQLITAYYKEKYKEIEIEGDQYLKKIIQIPINLPLWNIDDIERLVNDFVDKGIINNGYKDIIKNNIPLISTAIENNPREIKRFLNNFIIAFEIFSIVNEENSKENVIFDDKILLIMQAIQLRWNSFYNLLMNSDDKTRQNIFEEIEKLKNFKGEKILQILQSKEKAKNIDYDMEIIKLLEDFKFDIKLWNLLSNNIDLLKNIKDWNIYRRATELISESTSLKDNITIDSTPLLQSEGKVITIPNNVLQVDEFLSIIYWSFPRNRIGPLTYGKEWILVDKLSGRVFDDIGSRSSFIESEKINLDKDPMRLKKLEGHHTRKLIDVGIKPGMILYVTAPEVDTNDK